jgi:hypothetical protein
MRLRHLCVCPRLHFFTETRVSVAALNKSEGTGLLANFGGFPAHYPGNEHMFSKEPA